LEYNFVGLFPSSMNSISVSYQDSSIMTLGVTFSYDRYISGKVTSLAEASQNSNNQRRETSYSDTFKNRNITNLSTDQLTKIYQNANQYKFTRDTSLDTSNIEWPKTFATAKIVESSFRSF